MTNEHLRVLLVDDDEEEFFLLKDLLSQSAQPPGIPNIQIEWIAAYEAALEAFKDSPYDAYLIDYRLGEHSGIDLIREVVRLGCQAPLILLTGKGNYQVDLAAMQEGASDYLVKGQLNAPLLERSIRYAIERKGVQNELERRVQERTKELTEKSEQLIRAKNELEEKVAARTAELRHRAEELEALLTATAALLTTLNLEEMLEKILDAARSAIPAAEKEGLELVKTATQEPLGFLSKVMIEKQPLLIADCCHEMDRVLIEDLPDWQEVRSLIVAPLCLGEECLAPWPGAYSLLFF
jgi:DNA-binding response OmpR family regulator